MNQSTTILLIEDDPNVATSLRQGLEREGYTVVWKESGQVGIDYARQHTPHLIILDIRLPDGSGFDICRQIRQLGLHQPILILTVQNEEMDKILGLEMGADDYMTKPFSLRELRSRVRALLRRAYGEFATTDTDRLLIGDLLVDRTQNQVWRGQDPLNLTPIEFKLFTFLARHPGQSLTRSQIVEAIWGYEADIESERTVNVHIRRLRAKIELTPSHPTLILTVPGVGYRLAPPTL
ncbi:MAG: response regulator transcription factor [Chloroflexota bacterium]